MHIVLKEFEHNPDTILDDFNYYQMSLQQKKEFKSLVGSLNRKEFVADQQRSMVAESGQDRSRATKI